MSKKTAHSPNGIFCGYTVCTKCGLIYLKNQASQKAIKAACPGDD